MDQNAKQQQELVENATDDVYRRYMKGEIPKDAIPVEIAKALGKANTNAGTKLQASIQAMDVYGQKIYSLSDKIAGILDNVNELTAKMKTTSTSIGLMKDLLAQVPEHKERADIKDTVARPYFTPTQEALGDVLIDKFKVKFTAGWEDGTAGTAKLNEALTGSGAVVDAQRKAQLDAMTPEAKAAAVQEADLSKYTALELMYMSGMDATHAAYAIGTIFDGAGVGHENGSLVVPNGHATGPIYRELKNQYKTLWADGNIIPGLKPDPNGPIHSPDPFTWNIGDKTYTLTIDRDGDGQFDGQNEFVGALDGVNELTVADTDKNGELTAEEMAAAGFCVMENDQSFTGGGAYGWNGVKETGVKSINLKSFREIDELHQTNLNGNTRLSEFEVTLNDINGDQVDDVLTGKQTLIQEEYADTFYGHTVGEALYFGLDENEVAEALAAAAKPQNYTEAEEKVNDILTEVTEDTIDANT